MAEIETMPCPNCKRQHAHSEYRRQPHKQKPGGGMPVGPDDVECPCGATLEMAIPIFFVGRYGWEWRIIKPAGNP